MSGLTISRETNESVLIGDSITVTVVQIRKGRMQLNIVAPEDTPILRTELIGRRMDAGKPLCKIEQDIDYEDSLVRDWIALIADETSITSIQCNYQTHGTLISREAVELIEDAKANRIKELVR